jgi:hypothetical protein
MENQKKKDTLTLLETIVLLALNDKGWFGNSEQRIKFGLAGAILFELEQKGEIEIADNFICITSTKETGDKVLDAAIEVLRKSKKDLTLKRSIFRIVYKSGLKWKVILKNLVKNNILKVEKYQFLKIFSQDKYPLVNIEVKSLIVGSLYKKIVEGKELTPNDLILLTIMRTCKMIDKNFLLQEHFLKVRIKIKEITEFKDPLPESSRKIKALKEAMEQSIRASNVSLHV